MSVRSKADGKVGMGPDLSGNSVTDALTWQAFKDNRTQYVAKTMLMGAGKMSQSVKQLSYQHEDLRSTLAPGGKKKKQQKSEP